MFKSLIGEHAPGPPDLNEWERKQGDVIRSAVNVLTNT